MHTSITAAVVASERRFFTAMAVASLAVVFLGFAHSYYLWPLSRTMRLAAGQPASQSLPLLVHLHAAAFSTWIILLTLQSTLVTRGHVQWHRRLGSLGALLLPLLVVMGMATAVSGARRGWNPGGPYRDALSFMFVGVADLIVFTSLTTAGLLWRGQPWRHRRLMLLGTIGGLLWPAITRMPVIRGRFPLMFGLLAVLVLAPAVRDWIARARGRWLSLGLGLAILTTFPLRLAIGNSEAWRAVALWLVR